MRIGVWNEQIYRFIQFYNDFKIDILFETPCSSPEGVSMTIFFRRHFSTSEFSDICRWPLPLVVVHTYLMLCKILPTQTGPYASATMMFVTRLCCNIMMKFLLKNGIGGYRYGKEEDYQTRTKVMFGSFLYLSFICHFFPQDMTYLKLLSRINL